MDSAFSPLLQRGLAPRSKGKARAELRPARRQARLPHSRSLLLPGRERSKLGSAGRGSPRPEQPLGRGSALSRLGAELELRRSGSSLLDLFRNLWYTTIVGEGSKQVDEAGTAGGNKGNSGIERSTNSKS